MTTEQKLVELAKRLRERSDRLYRFNYDMTDADRAVTTALSEVADLIEEVFVNEETNA